MTYPTSRPRRIRQSAAIRKLVSEVALDPEKLIAPLFVKEGIDKPVPVVSMPGVSQNPVSSITGRVRDVVSAGVHAVILFGVPEAKDPLGSGASMPDGVVQSAIRRIRSDFSDEVLVIADLCLDEFTDHGHCGVLTASGEVDNDATLDRYREIAVSLADAGAEFVAPSGMMDGQVAAIRGALDSRGYTQVGIMAYAAKFASSFYGPFRDAAECAPGFGNRDSYQIDPANAHEAIREALFDEDEGADVLMVKPAGPYLDVIRAVREATHLPLAAYQVSGEYSAIRAAAEAGFLKEDAAVAESLLGIFRAGADMVITYFAEQVARALG